MSDLAWMRPKLAELCGAQLNSSTVIDHYEFSDACLIKLSRWRPDENVAQAIRCLEALPKIFRIEIVKWEQDSRYWSVTLWDLSLAPNGLYGHDDLSLTCGICLAIAAALSWEKP